MKKVHGISNTKNRFIVQKYCGSKRSFCAKNVKVGRFTVPLIYFITYVCFVLAIVMLNIQAASMGAKFSYLEIKEEELIKQKHDLEDLVVRTSSLSKISEKAEELGFGSPQEVVYLTTEATVAKLL